MALNTRPTAAPWYFEDFKVGQLFRSQGRTITESDLVTFAWWSWDTNPVHTDAEHTRGGRFGQPIAHGLLGVSVAMGLASRMGVFEACSVALLSIDGWRFEHPVHVGDTLTCEVTIASTRATSGGGTGVLGRSFTLSNQEGKVVQRGAIDLLAQRRSQPDESQRS